jgi:tyrosine-protein kinase Etk/Wzc
MENIILNGGLEQDFQLKAILDKYLMHWKWFLLGISTALVIAFLYLRYNVPQYQAATTILVKDEKKGGMLSELSAFADLGAGVGIKNNIDNEIEILKSRTLVESAVKKLGLNISLIVKGKMVDADLFGKAPIAVDFSNRKADFYTSNFVITFKELSASTFKLGSELPKEPLRMLLQKNKVFRYGELIRTQLGDLVINRSNAGLNPTKDQNNEVSIVISPLENIVNSFKGRLKVTPLNKNSNVVELSIIDPVMQKGEAFLDTLVQIYNHNAVVDKNYIAENTSKFIMGRLGLITQELGGVEQNIQSFKKVNNLTNIESDAVLFTQESSEYNKKGVEVEIQLNVVSSLLGFMKKSSNSDLLPNNIVVGEVGASELINSYNQLVLERNRILKTATVANPSVIKIEQQIASLKANVAASLRRLQSNLEIQKRDLNSQEESFNTKIGKIPVQEREFRVIARQQKVKEELYLYLLQKREETAISLSATEPNARVIDAAKGSRSPVSPKRNVIFMIAFSLGFLVPFGIIYLIDLFDTKIKNRADLEGKTVIPFLGNLPESDSPNEIIRSESRSSSAEAMRIIKANLAFMFGNVADGVAKTIFVTSTLANEGKTLVSVNLAATYALSGKKVLLIEMDFRNPGFQEFLQVPDCGVTNYLSSKEIDLEDVIFKKEGYDNFFVLPAGVIPPNPTELLMSEKVDDLFETVKTQTEYIIPFETLKTQYDYIIVDTCPVSLVADTLMIAKHADCFVYVIRANFLEKRMLSTPNLLYYEGKLPNMCLLLNCTDTSSGYGYGYGYQRPVEKEIWYKKIFTKR